MKKALTAIAALLVATASQADPYVVVSAGVANHDVDCTGTTSCDKRGTGLKLIGGYKLTPNFAVEGGYLSFGKSEFSGPGLGGTIGASVKVSGFGIGAAFHHDLNPNWDVVGRLGVASLDADYDLTFNGASVDSGSDSSTKLYGGFGVGYKISPNLSLNAAYDFSKAKLLDEDLKVNMFSVGMTYSF
jgi:outer membrane autotransporter protein